MEARSPVSTVARRLLDLFTGGAIEPGTRLPTERQLVTALGVGRSAVREALAALEILGVVDVRPGSGTYLRGTASELLPQTLSWGLLIGERNTVELLEIRTGLEVYMARLAAERGDPDAIRPAEKFLNRMRISLTDLEIYSQADLDFHRVLERAAGNAVLSDLLHVVRSLLQVYADRILSETEVASAALGEHQAVFDAVMSGDGDAAATAMAKHMRTATARLLALVQSES